jgi:hypothetical protein
MKTNTVRPSTAPPLYRLAFDDVVSDLLKVKAAADTSQRAGQKTQTRPNKTTGRSRRKGYGIGKKDLKLKRILEED